MVKLAPAGLPLDHATRRAGVPPANMAGQASHATRRGHLARACRASHSIHITIVRKGREEERGGTEPRRAALRTTRRDPSPAAREAWSSKQRLDHATRACVLHGDPRTCRHVVAKRRLAVASHPAEGREKERGGTEPRRAAHLRGRGGCAYFAGLGIRWMGGRGDGDGEFAWMSAVCYVGRGVWAAGGVSVLREALPDGP